MPYAARLNFRLLGTDYKPGMVIPAKVHAQLEPRLIEGMLARNKIAEVEREQPQQPTSRSRTKRKTTKKRKVKT